MEETASPRGLAEPVTRKLLEDYLKVHSPEIPLGTEETERFLVVAIRFQLNPFLREIHLVSSEDKGKRKTVAVVGYEVYLRKAERTGKLDGWKTWTDGEGDQLKAVLEIYRHDWAHPFVHEVHFTEAVQRRPDGQVTAFWQKMPKFQLRKVCISQGFRLCFPDELGGIPYDPAELSLDVNTQASPVGMPPKEQSVPAPKPQAPAETAFDELKNYLEANQGQFTVKHLKWIRDQIEKTPTAEKAKAMLGYARKVVSQGGDPPDLSRTPRTYNRTRIKPEPIPEPTF